ncbi:glycosyltransferase [Shouchella clausii]|uniref:glycosyltransferase n=1 Tax=Shouchella clausii TaxID=79880 RepID=UPI000BA6E8A3|nr:glycosyltransferase [Shouchella clausii]PAE96540.1 hypothetical protein CHH70_01125 [Shouchella clausii]
MKKILYIVSVFPSTSATFVLNEMLALKREGYEIEIVSLRTPKDEVLQSGVENFVDNIIYVPHVKNSSMDKLKLAYTNLMYLFSNPVKYTKLLFNSIQHRSLNQIYDFLRAAYVASVMGEVKVDHVHAQFAHAPTSIAYYLKILTGKKYSFTCHAVDIFVPKNASMLEEKVKHAEFVATISNYNVKYIENKLRNKSLSNKIRVIRCGIDLNNFKRDREKKERKIVNIFSVGRFVEKKGFSYLVEALKLVSDNGFSYNCNIIGEGPLFNDIKDKIKKTGLENNINLLGKADSITVKRYLQDADIFVLPCVTAQNGDMDGIPVSLMEAMAYEVPVISTSISGIPELVKHKVNGLIVKEKNSTELAEAIQSLILEQDSRILYGKEGRKYISTEFRLDRNTKKLVCLFNSIYKNP